MADVRRLKEELKELRKAVALERGRIEDLFVEDRRGTSRPGGSATSAIH